MVKSVTPTVCVSVDGGLACGMRILDCCALTTTDASSTSASAPARAKNFPGVFISSFSSLMLRLEGLFEGGRALARTLSFESGRDYRRTRSYAANVNKKH